MDNGDNSLVGYFDNKGYTVWFLYIADYGTFGASQLIMWLSGTDRINVLDCWDAVTSGCFTAIYLDMIKKLMPYAPITAGPGDIQITALFHANDRHNVADYFQPNCRHYDGKSSPNNGCRDLLVVPMKRLISTADIQVKTLLILGDKDLYVSVLLAEEALGTLPDSSPKHLLARCD